MRTRLVAVTWIIGLSLVGALSLASSGPAVEVVAHDVPAALAPGSRHQVSLTLVNRGSEPWDPARGFKVSYHWFDATGEPMVWDGVRSELTEVVGVGDTVRLEAALEAPAGEGTAELQWDVVREGHRWESETAATPPERIAVTLKAALAFTVVRGSSPRWIGAGNRARCELVVRNDGTVDWPAGGKIALSYHWLEPDGEPVVWDGLRTALPVMVPPGSEAALSATVEAPDRPGRYRLQWDMVYEGVAWFSQRDPSPPPPSRVFVWRVTVGPAGWAMASLALAMVAVAVSSGRLSRLAAVMASADVLWCLAAVVVKQRVVLEQLGQTAGPWASLLTVAGLAVLLLPALWLRPSIRVWWCWLLAAAATVVLYADMIYGRFFGDILSMSVARAASHADEVSASIVSLQQTWDLWFWLDLAAGAILAVAVARIAKASDNRRPKALVALLAAVVVVGLVVVSALLRTHRVSLHQVFRNVYVAREIGTVNFHLADVTQWLIRGGAPAALDQAEVERLAEWFENRRPLRAGVGPWFGVAEGHNVVMVQAESLQDFVLNLEIRGHEITPFLNRWARGSARWTNVTDQTSQGRSSDAELSTQVSLLPPAVGAAAFLYAGNSFTGLAGVLAERGYATVSAVAFEPSFWNRQFTHRAYGYERSLFEDDFTGGTVVGWGLNDRGFFRQMAGRLADTPEPFCAYLLTLSLHHPFEGFPDRLKELELGDLEGTPMGNYLHTMRFFDRAFEALIGELSDRGLLERTVVVVWGDHDAGFEWTPELASLTGDSPDPVGWYQSQRVPLLIRCPEAGGPAGVRAVPAGHQDVAPTVLALLGVDPSQYAYVGRNLLGRPGDGPVVGEYHCWRDDGHIFLQGGGHLEDGECYRLPGAKPVAVEDCANGFADAMAQVEASRLVLEHDLQLELHHRLDRTLAGDRTP